MFCLFVDDADVVTDSSNFYFESLKNVIAFTIVLFLKKEKKCNLGKIPSRTVIF